MCNVVVATVIGTSYGNIFTTKPRRADESRSQITLCCKKAGTLAKHTGDLGAIPGMREGEHRTI